MFSENISCIFQIYPYLNKDMDFFLSGLALEQNLTNCGTKCKKMCGIWNKLYFFDNVFSENIALLFLLC